MNRKQGLAKLKQLHGANATYRESASALAGAERAAAMSLVPNLRAEAERLSESLKARRQAILAADSDYQALLVASKAAQAAYDETKSVYHHRRVTVGLSNGFGFIVKGEGDNWQEAIDAACAKKA